MLARAITSSHVPIARPPSACSPIQATDKYLPGPSAGSGVTAQSALLVFVHVENHRLVAFAANDFLPMLKVEPALAAAILPAGRAAGPAIFDEEIAGVGVHVRHAPRQPVRAADRHDRAAGQRGAHRVLAVAPVERDLVPDRRQPVHFQVRIGRQQRVAGGAARGAHGPGVAAGQPRQIGQQLQRFVGEPLGDVDLAERLEIDAVEVRMEQLAQPLVVDAELNQLQQQPLVLLLDDRQAGEAQQLADEHHRRRAPTAAAESR